jgi:adenosylcobinamide-phosphate synthase
VLIVYLTLGFRHYSHYFTSIQLALNAGDEAAARTCWPNGPSRTRWAWKRVKSPASRSKKR